MNQLFNRELPPLRRWAHSQVPQTLWPQVDVDDFVQLTFIRALRRYREFHVREGATFQYYLRRILINLVRDALRTAARQPVLLEFSSIEINIEPDGLDLVLGKEAHRRYRRALQLLAPRTRAALVARLEHGAAYADIALRVGLPTAGAARALVARGAVRLTSEMRAAAKRRRPSRAAARADVDRRN